MKTTEYTQSSVQEKDAKTEREQALQLMDPRLIEALNHPHRSAAMSIFAQREASASEIAEELGLPAPNMNHHVKRLHELDCIVQVRTEPRRGATEIYYRANVRHFFDESMWPQVPEDERLEIISNVIQMMSKDLALASVHGGFARDDIHVSRVPMSLDLEGWEKIALVLKTTLDQIFRIRDESRMRQEAGGGEPILATVLMLSFEVPPIAGSD